MVPKNRDSEANRVKEAFAQESCPPASYQSMTRMSMQREQGRVVATSTNRAGSMSTQKSCPVQSGRGQGE